MLLIYTQNDPNILCSQELKKLSFYFIKKLQIFSHQHYTKVVLEAASEQDLTSVAAKLTENNIRDEKKSLKKFLFLDQSMLEFMLESFKLSAS